MNIEKQWITNAGLGAMVCVMPAGHRCGYVSSPKHLVGRDYDDLPGEIDVHGGLTFAGDYSEYDIDGYWFGYDCAHYCDGRDAELMDERHKVFYEKYGSLGAGPVRTLDFCVKECEELARQLLRVAA